MLCKCSLYIGSRNGIDKIIGKIIDKFYAERSSFKEPAPSMPIRPTTNREEGDLRWSVAAEML